MTIVTGTVQSGTVVWDGGPPPDGTKVTAAVPAPDEADQPTLIGLLKFAGKAVGLPADFAEQHDHYIHGTPKR